VPSTTPDLEQLVASVRAGDRVQLARAITLVESALPADQKLAQEVLDYVLPHTGGAIRVGISGVPGVGKSTFIEALGTRLVAGGHRVAVLAVDPSSTLSGGSILGDKSRMPDLAREPDAFIRPSPSAASLGGVARRTRESMLLCEAAGFDVVLVETVGVGQSETAVADMVDFFLVLMLPGAGDELQGIKKGILELADLVAVNKADGEQLALAHTAVRDYSATLRLARPRSACWTPRAMAVSSRTGEGVDELWQIVLEHRAALASAAEAGEPSSLEERRREQLGRWMWSMVEERLLEDFRAHPGVSAHLEAVEAAVREGRSTPARAMRELFEFLATEG
jgi:LAO/AO transport system kinase